MKNMQPTAGQPTVGTSKGVEIVFTASSNDVAWTLTGSFPVVNDDMEGSRKLWQAAFGQVVYRSTEGKKALPEGGGEVSFSALWKAVSALTFRGEAVPTKADKALAEQWLKAIKAGVHKPGVVAKTLTEKYGQPVEETLESLTQHFFRRRLEDESAKAKLDLGNL